MSGRFMPARLVRVPPARTSVRTAPPSMAATRNSISPSRRKMRPPGSISLASAA